VGWVVQTVCACANVAVVLAVKIIQIIFMTTCWLYGYIISSVLLSIYERERERERDGFKDTSGESTPFLS